MSQRRTSRNQPHLPIPIHARYRRCDPQKLVHVEAPTTYHLPHTPQSRYVPTYLFLFLHNGNLFYPFNCYPYHSLAQTQTQTQKLQAKYYTYLTYPEFLSYQSIQSVNWSLAVQTRDPRLTSGIRDGEVANNDGGLPYYPSWVISQTGAAQWVDGRLAMVVVYVCYSGA